MLKRTVLICLLGMNACYAKQLTNYNDVLDAAYQGKRLTFVLDNNACNIKDQPYKADFISVISGDSYNILKSGSKDSSIFLRDTNVGHKLISKPELDAVTQTYSLELKSDGSVHLVDHILDPVKYTEKLPTVEEDCQLGKSVKIFTH